MAPPPVAPLAPVLPIAPVSPIAPCGPVEPPNEKQPSKANVVIAMEILPKQNSLPIQTGVIKFIKHDKNSKKRKKNLTDKF
jgi:hypothetical protein